MIFVDTSYWIALYNRRDSRHQAATSLLQEHASAPWVTSNHVLGETWTFLRRREGHGPAVNFLDAVESSTRVAVLFAGEDVEAAARRWLRRHDERSYSFVDGTSFEIMRAHRMRSALAFDDDFAAAGFLELRPN